MRVDENNLITYFLVNLCDILYIHIGAHTKYRQLVDLAVLLGEEAERLGGHILINSIDVAKEWHSRWAGDRDGHGAAKSVGGRGGWSDLVQ